jgi:predicted ATP-dependent protease
VIIPAANVRDLMLRQELCDAVAAGQFHIWAVRTIDEGLTLLTGVLAGERGPDGVYPQGTVHGAVQKRLRQLAIDLEVFGKDEQEKRSEDTQPGR